MNVVLCLLSDQHVPNLLSVHHYRPDHLVLVESERIKRREMARHFIEALAKGGLDYRLRCHVQPLTAEDDLRGIRAALQEAYGGLPSATWIANVTGGTKPMSIATYDFFKSHGDKVVYTDAAKPDRIVDLETSAAEICTHRPTVDEFVTGYGFRLVKPSQNLEDAKERAGQQLWRTTANLLAAAEAGYNGPAIDEAAWEKLRKRGLELNADQLAFPQDELRRLWLDGLPSRKFTKYEGEFLTGNWLEVFLYNLLSRYAEQLGIWDVALGQHIGKENAGPGESNDIDVCFMHRNALAMVECKTGSQENDPGGTSTLYKTDAVARQQGALRVRSFFATTAANVLDESGTVRESLQRRADMYGCAIITKDQIRELAELELQESSKSADRVKQVFHL